MKTVMAMMLAICSMVMSGILLSCSNSSGQSDISSPTQTSIASRTISGTISYSGKIQPPRQIVIVATRIGEQAPAYSMVISSPGNYALKNITDASYVISAFMDIGEDMGPPQANEPAGYYDTDGDAKANEVMLMNGKGVEGINITLLDP